jgi:hypothetical protein
MPTRRFVLEMRSSGKTVKPSTTAPRPKQTNEKPVPNMRQARFDRRPETRAA